MKKILYLITLILLPANLLFQTDINLYAGSELPVTTAAGTPAADLSQASLSQAGLSQADLSFEDFLKQFQTQDQNKDLFAMPKQKKSVNEGERLEKEIVNLLNQKITPLASDISKIVQSPDSKKALEEKKKEREQKQKEADRRIEQMKLRRPYGYTPSYRPSGGYGRDYSPSSSRGRGYGSGGYGSGYDGYSPRSSYWDKTKGESSLSNKEGKPETGGKEEKKKEEKGDKGSGDDKDTKKAIASIDNLTTRIQAILSREIPKIGNKAAIQELATGMTLVDLKKLFDEREQELWKIPKKQKFGVSNEKSGKTGSKKTTAHRKATNVTEYGSAESNIKNLAAEKNNWEKFAPQIINAIKAETDSEGMTAAQNAGYDLLSSLKSRGYIRELPAGYSELRKEKPGKKEKPETEEKAKSKEKTAAALNRIKTQKQRIEKLISQNLKDLKPKSTNPADIEKVDEFFKQLSKLFEDRDKGIVELEHPLTIIESKDEKALWAKVLPAIIQSITYSEGKTSRELFDRLKNYGYITESAINPEISKIEKDLLQEFQKAKTSAEQEKIGRMAIKIPGEIKNTKLKDLISKFKAYEKQKALAKKQKALKAKSKAIAKKGSKKKNLKKKK